MLLTRQPTPAALFESNRGLVGVALRSFPNLPLSLRDDAEAAALLGLWLAAQGYDGGRGHAFSTYAVACIKGRVLRELRRLSPPDAPPCLSLDAPATADGEATLGDLLPDPGSRRAIDALEAAASFESLLKPLSRREAELIRRVYLDGQSLRDIALSSGLSHQTLAVNHRKAIRRLQSLWNSAVPVPTEHAPAAGCSP